MGEGLLDKADRLSHVLKGLIFSLVRVNYDSVCDLLMDFNVDILTLVTDKVEFLKS